MGADFSDEELQLFQLQESMLQRRVLRTTEVLLVSPEVDSLGIVGAKYGSRTFHHGPLDLNIAGALIHEIPDLEGLVGEESASPVPAELYAGGVALF